MPEQSAGSAATKVLGALVSAALGGLVWLTAGANGVIGLLLAGILSVLSAIGAPVALIIYQRYLGVLAAGGRPKGSPARLAYEELRDSLSLGNLAARLYSRWLSVFLDAVDRFFGDAGKTETGGSPASGSRTRPSRLHPRHVVSKCGQAYGSEVPANQTLFPRAFGLKTPAPLWTAPALDRCLLLALIYPVATIFIIWAITGHVGPAEGALGLMADLSPWRRGISVVLTGLTGFVVFALVSGFRTIGSIAFFSLIAAGVALGFAIAIVGSGVVATAVGIAFGAIATGSGFGAGTGVLAITGLVVFNIGGVIAAFLVVFVIDFVGYIATEHRWHSLFLSLFFLGIIVVCLWMAHFRSALEDWAAAGPVLLFMGLLTLINAPFVWISLGLTRALLRRGLELGSWWPYLLATADAALAALIVAALALTMVIGVQTFDALAQHGGGKAILPLDTLFDGITVHPADPEYWWVYALLLTTVLPSMVNLMVGGASLLRGVPVLPRVILRKLPIGKAVPDFDRTWIALVLTLQIVMGAALGIAAQVLLIVGIIGYVMPWLGLGLLDMARDVAAFNLPARIGQLFSGL